jgi:hypothetical protein
MKVRSVAELVRLAEELSSSGVALEPWMEEGRVVGTLVP